MIEISDYSTTRRLTTEKPCCFDAPVDGIATLLKIPNSDQEIDEGGLRLQGLFKSGSDDEPLITVVTVVYNGAEYLEDTIKSVIEQTYDNVEYIIVDGGSKDCTLDIIRKYEHAIDYWVSEPDKGIYDAMNKGIDLGCGDWINFMNSADTFYKSSLLVEIVPYFQDSLAVYFGFARVFDESTDRLYPRIENKFLNNWLTNNVPNHQAMFFPKIFYATNKYDLSYKYFSDADYKYRAKKKIRFIFLTQTIVNFRLGGISSSYKDIGLFVAQVFEIIRYSFSHVGIFFALKSGLFFFGKFTLHKVKSSCVFVKDYFGRFW